MRFEPVGDRSQPTVISLDTQAVKTTGKMSWKTIGGVILGLVVDAAMKDRDDSDSNPGEYQLILRSPKNELP